jgi:hypothetical protein
MKGHSFIQDVTKHLLYVRQWRKTKKKDNRNCPVGLLGWGM